MTPIDIETMEFKKTAFGYSVDEVDTFLDKVIAEFEKLYRENAKLRDKIDNLVEAVKYFQGMEDTIRNSIVRAEKNAEETKKLAEDQADQIIKNAEVRAESILQNTRIEQSKLRSDIVALKSQYEGLRASLKALLETQMKMLEINNQEFISDEPVENENSEEENV